MDSRPAIIFYIKQYKIINFYIPDHYYPVYGSESDKIYLYGKLVVPKR